MSTEYVEVEKTVRCCFLTISSQSIEKTKQKKKVVKKLFAKKKIEKFLYDTIQSATEPQKPKSVDIQCLH